MFIEDRSTVYVTSVPVQDIFSMSPPLIVFLPFDLQLTKKKHFNDIYILKKTELKFRKHF